MRLSARNIADLLKNADWRTGTPLVTALIQIVKDVVLMNPHNRLITAFALVHVWLECPILPLKLSC